MNAIVWVIIFVLLTFGAIAAAIWHYSIDASLGGVVIIHAFNIGLGLVNIGRAIAFGINFGWTK